jgi:hypothetical protein
MATPVIKNTSSNTHAVTRRADPTGSLTAPCRLAHIDEHPDNSSHNQESAQSRQIQKHVTSFRILPAQRSRGQQWSQYISVSLCTYFEHCVTGLQSLHPQLRSSATPGTFAHNSRVVLRRRPQPQLLLSPAPYRPCEWPASRSPAPGAAELRASGSRASLTPGSQRWMKKAGVATGLAVSRQTAIRTSRRYATAGFRRWSHPHHRCR